MAFDNSKLRGRIAEKGTSYKALAAELGITSQTFGRKMNGSYPFNQDEIFKICKLLDIDVENINDYFFTLSSQGE